MSGSNALDRANEAIARARARRSGVVTPDSAISPYDADATQEIPRVAISAVDRGAGSRAAGSRAAGSGDDGTVGDADFGPGHGWSLR